MAGGCSGPREQHTPRGDVAVAPPPSVHDGSSGDAGGLLGLLPANTVHETTENLHFLLQAGRAQDAADFLGGLQKVPNDSGFDDDSSPTIAALAVHCPEGTAEPPVIHDGQLDRLGYLRGACEGGSDHPTGRLWVQLTTTVEPLG
jgi:hypothetical protein